MPELSKIQKKTYFSNISYDSLYHPTNLNQPVCRETKHTKLIEGYIVQTKTSKGV